MSRIAFALFLLAVGLCWLLPLAPQAQAVSNPYLVQHCGDPNGIYPSASTASSWTCYLYNTQSGDTVTVFALSATLTTAPSISISSTETLTCPAGTTISNASVYTTKCYVATTSSHTTFSVTLTLTPGSGNSVLEGFSVKAYRGLGAVDASSATSAKTDSTSVSVTTAANNEFVDVSCQAQSNDGNPGSGMTQQFLTYNVNPGAGGERVVDEFKSFATAGTNTVSCSFTTVAAGTGYISAIAFAQGTPTLPAVYVVQSCYFNYNSGGSALSGCNLNGTTSGNKVVIPYVTVGATTPQTFTCTETCTCPSAAQGSFTYSTRQYNIGVCYADTTSSHATFNVTENSNNAVVSMVPKEIFGLLSGADTGSGARTNATSVSYTTGGANEWTFGIAADVAGNPILPGNSFLQMNETIIRSDAPLVIFQGTDMYKQTIPSGSNTISYTLTGSADPLIATLSFGPSSANPRHSQIIGYHGGARVRRIPWNRPRKVIELERI